MLSSVVESLTEVSHIEWCSSLHVIQYKLGPRDHIRFFLHDKLTIRYRVVYGIGIMTKATFVQHSRLPPLITPYIAHICRGVEWFFFSAFVKYEYRLINLPDLRSTRSTQPPAIKTRQILPKVHRLHVLVRLIELRYIRSNLTASFLYKFLESVSYAWLCYRCYVDVNRFYFGSSSYDSVMHTAPGIFLHACYFDHLVSYIYSRISSVYLLSVF